MEETSGSKAIVTTDKIRKFNTFSTLVNKWNGHKLREFDRLVDPDKQLDVLHHKGTDLAPAEILYTHGLWETKQKVYEHFSEETVRCTGEDQVIIPFINRDSKQKLLDQDLLIIHIGLVLIKITGTNRISSGGRVILNLVDTRYSNDIQRAIIGTMEVDMARNSGVIYMAPKMQMTVTDFAKHFQLIIKTRGYEDFTEGQNLAITKILTGRLSNNTNNNFKLKIDRVMQYLGSQGIKAIEGKAFTAKDLAGKEWNITLPATQPLVPSRTSFWNITTNRTHTLMEEDEYDLPYPQQSSQHTQIPSAGQQQGRQRGRNFPYEYINNLPRVNVNDGSMLILSDNESVAVSCIIDSGASRSCISPNAIPKHFYEEMYGQKFEMNKGKTSVKSEQGDSSEPTKEIMTFGSTVLVKYPPGHSKAFKPLPHLPTPDESQQCLLDALWNASTAKQKHTALNALNFYFSKILEKPLSKNFSFYVLFERRKAGNLH
ncbi:hypothetical protein K1719_017678 [Acacia pycnantha]|nr:hypothetical protein K1719_017678 [Acacia pycnantha]